MVEIMPLLFLVIHSLILRVNLRLSCRPLFGPFVTFATISHSIHSPSLQTTNHWLVLKRFHWIRTTPAGMHIGPPWISMSGPLCIVRALNTTVSMLCLVYLCNLYKNPPNSESSKFSFSGDPNTQHTGSRHTSVCSHTACSQFSGALRQNKVLMKITIFFLCVPYSDDLPFSVRFWCVFHMIIFCSCSSCIL